jgi:hypothetical protein
VLGQYVDHVAPRRATMPSRRAAETLVGERLAKHLELRLVGVWTVSIDPYFRGAIGVWSTS